VDPDWPLAGRSAEVAFVTDAIEVGTGVVIAGPAGVGKTRLAREAVARLTANDDLVAETIAATRASAAIPLGVFAHLDEGRSAAFITPIGAIRHALLERARGRRLLLVVDDAHALDAASSAVVHQLAASGDATVLATVRSREATPDAVTALWKDGLCDRLDLQTLSDRETGELLELVLDGPVDARTRHDLWDATQGNLLFLRELVGEGLASSALAWDAGRWRWAGEIHAPRRVAEMLATQFDTLDAAERDALELVALGEPLEWEVLSQLAPAATAAVQRGLITVEREDKRVRARLWHPLTGDVVRTRIALPRMQAHLRNLASAIELSGARRRHDVLRIVGWRRDAGDPVDAEALIDAARRCVAVDPPQAEALARLAIDSGGGVPAVITLAQQLMFSRRAADAAALLADPPVQPASTHDEVALAIMRANNLTFGLGDGAAGAALLDELRARLDDKELRDELLSQTVPMLLFAGRVDESTRRADAIVDDETVAVVHRVRARAARVACVAVAGHPVTAQLDAQRAFTEIGSGLDALPMATGQVAAGLILALQWSGELGAADSLSRAGYDEGTRRRADLLRGVSALHLGVGALWRGEVRTAATFLREAVEALRENDVGLLGWAIDNLRAAVAMSADPPPDLAEPPCRHQLYETERLRLTACVAAARNDRRRALDLVARAAAAARSSALQTQLAFALFDAARYGGGSPVLEELDDIAATAEGPLLPALASAATALVSDDAGALDRCSVDLEAMGFVLFAAEMSRAAAVSHQAAGLRARAMASERRAGELAERCEGAATPLLAAGPGIATDLLTSRERDIARLAASGVSNAEIAQRLGLSVRTVETHLQRAYTKLGIHGRAELSGAV
jgi:DNA-binding NarL/FixJ family response regulator